MHMTPVSQILWGCGPTLATPETIFHHRWSHLATKAAHAPHHGSKVHNPIPLLSYVSPKHPAVYYLFFALFINRQFQSFNGRQG